MNHLFIINPVAGKSRTLKFIPEIEKIFSNRSEQYFIEITQYSGHAIEIARKFSQENNYRIYSVGGDGTLNEVLNGMVGSSSSLAVIPGGSGNDFIKSLRSDLSMKDLLARTIDGKVELLDLAKVNDRYFINIASVGFDAEVVHSAMRLKKFPFLTGKMAYLTGVITALLKGNTYGMELWIDGKYIKRKCLLLTVSNGRYYGGGMMPTPHAMLNDGNLDICLIEKVSRLKLLMLLPRFIKGKHESLKEVSFYSAQKVEIRFDKPAALNYDGEVDRVKEVIFEVIPKGISVVIPRQN